MRVNRALCACVIVCSSIALHGQQPGSSQPPAVRKPARVPYYIDPTLLNAGLLLADPPAVGSAANNAEIAILHHLEDTRTPQLAANAKADEGEEDIFIFKTVLGARFTPNAFPVTAALGAHVKNEQGVVGALLKHSFQRPRPYQTDSTLHPVCEVKTVHDSYPSGHAFTGYLEALTLVELFPDQRNKILARADDYAHNRLVCGVHYPSDIEASRRIAYAVFGFMLATPKFQEDLEASRHEIRKRSSLGSK
jgi:acid phosphatase (class A)